MKRIPTRLKQRLVEARNHWRDSYCRLRLSWRIAKSEAGSRSVSVAIPFYDNAAMGHLALFNILNDKRVTEIIILDDFSTAKEFNTLKRKVAPFHKKVRLYRRSENFGALAYKIQAVSLCQCRWVILLDYDNTLTKQYLDAMFSLPSWDTDSIYCSDFAYPQFPFNELSGTTIDFQSACDMAVDDLFNGPFFNDGNYLVSRDNFVEALKPYWRCHVAASDVVFANYTWLSNGGKLKVVKGSRYIHRVHGGSTWLNTQGDSLRILSSIMHAFKTRVTPDDGWIERELKQKPNEWKEPALIPLG